MFSKLPHLMYGWFIQPFHISLTVIKPTQHLKHTSSSKNEVEKNAQRKSTAA